MFVYARQTNLWLFFPEFFPEYHPTDYVLLTNKAAQPGCAISILKRDTIRRYFMTPSVCMHSETKSLPYVSPDPYDLRDDCHSYYHLQLVCLPRFDLILYLCHYTDGMLYPTRLPSYLPHGWTFTEITASAGLNIKDQYLLFSGNHRVSAHSVQSIVASPGITLCTAMYRLALSESTVR